MNATTEQTHAPTSQLQSLQAGRGIAAILVVLFHTGGSIFALHQYWGHDPLHNFFAFGHAGVAFFFVLSGFIIMHAHRNDWGKPQQFLPFLCKRGLRLYPFYWLILAPVILAYLLIPTLGEGFEHNIMNILESVLLVHMTDANTILRVAWTLYHEILFYLIFATAILHRRLGLALMLLWLMAILLGFSAAPPSNPQIYAVSVWTFLTAPINLLFMMGIGAQLWLSQRNKLTRDTLCAAAGVILFLATGMEEDFLHKLPLNFSNLLYGLGSMLAILGFVSLEHREAFCVPPMMQRLGDASYAIYLIHFPLLSLLAKLVSHAPIAKAVPALLFSILLPTLCIGVGVAAHLMVEKPLLFWLRTRWLSEPMPAAHH